MFSATNVMFLFYTEKDYGKIFTEFGCYKAIKTRKAT